MSEKFCLKWNDFQTNISNSFANLRSEEDFSDVTLVSDDQRIFKAHKIVLLSCSDYFKNILKTKKHFDPMLCLVGFNSLELSHILDYMYDGEVSIYQEELDMFIDKAQQLQLKGLLKSQNEVGDQHQNFISPKTLPSEDPYLRDRMNATKIEVEKE